MTALCQLLRTSRFILFIVLVMSLFWESCDNAKKQTSAATLAAAEDTLPDKLDALKAATLIKNFQSADDQLTGDFYFGGDTSTKNKAVYFQLNSKQIESLFKEIKQQKIAAKPVDSMQIRVHMALLEKEGNKRPGQPNLTLLLDLIKNGKTSANGDHGYYPLRPFQKLNHAISGQLADSLTQEWNKIPAENLVQQLYINGKISDVKNRIRHYTFNAQDTEAIYAYWGRNPDCGLSIYLGQYEEKDHVPMRVIIRLTPNASSQGKNGGEENFEFAGQCPPICQ